MLAVPFFVGGLCVSLVMAHGSIRIGRVYFADLAGAGLGCLGVVLAMETMPAPQVVLPTALLAAVGSLGFALNARPRRVALPTVILAVVAMIGAYAVRADLLRMKYIKFAADYYASYEAWNAFSRVSAAETPSNAAELLPLKYPREHYGGTRYPATMNPSTSTAPPGRR
jgi:hypothetical protein